MQFPIGSHVKLSMYTGDDQIDRYYGQTLEVVDYCQIPHDIAYSDMFGRAMYRTIPSYTIVAPDGIVITANEYELEAI